MITYLRLNCIPNSFNRETSKVSLVGTTGAVTIGFPIAEIILHANNQFLTKDDFFQICTAVKAGDPDNHLCDVWSNEAIYEYMLHMNWLSIETGFNDKDAMSRLVKTSSIHMSHIKGSKSHNVPLFPSYANGQNGRVPLSSILKSLKCDFIYRQQQQKLLALISPKNSHSEYQNCPVAELVMAVKGSALFPSSESVYIAVGGLFENNAIALASSDLTI